MRRWLMKTGIVTVATALITGAVGMLGHSSAYAAKAATEVQKTDEKKTVRFIGSSESKKYHKPSCEWVKKISKANRVEFSSAAEAKKAGYAPCKICLSAKETAGTAVDSKSAKAGKTNTKTTDKSTKAGE